MKKETENHNEEIEREEELAAAALSREMKKTAESMTVDEARHLVDMYYQMQNNRLRAAGQIRSMKDEQHDIITHFEGRFKREESQILGALKVYAKSQHMGRWAIENVIGIGPVIATGLVAHIDMQKAKTASDVWAFAGLDPSKKWEKKTKRPWNAALKVICWKAGESFVKVKNNPESKYGKLYDERKVYEQAKNEAGDYAEQAKSKLEAQKIGKNTEAYKWYSIGKLPPGHIHARAKRYAVKRFLCDWWTEAYRHEFGKEPPEPWVFAIAGHAHKD